MKTSSTQTSSIHPQQGLLPESIDNRPSAVSADDIPSVNFHLWEPCNMKCKGCFATFRDVKADVLPKGHMSREHTIEVVDRLADFGFSKITFVGGEPLLCPWLDQLIARAKCKSMTTMIVTNGSRLTDDFLDRVEECLDWVTLSYDSTNPDTLLKIGRAVAGKQVIEQERYMELARMVKTRRMRLKVNTVVNQHNWQEEMAKMICKLGPERWKVFQVMAVAGQNDGSVEDLLIDDAQFAHFLTINKQASAYGITVCPEPNNLMRGSYVMIDPAGRFFDSLAGSHHYSPPILQIGVEAALGHVSVSVDRFEERAGRYEW